MVPAREIPRAKLPSMAEDAPTFAQAAADFRFDLPWLVVIVAMGTWYGLAFLRARRLGPRRAHPGLRAVAFAAGVLALVAGVLSPISRYGDQFLWVNFLGMFLVTMVAAPLLVLGAPLTLAFRVASPRRRRFLRWVYRGRLAAVLTFPVVAWLIFAVATYAWQFTGLTDAAARHWVVRDLQQGSLFAVSLLFWTPALCADPVRWRMAHPLRALYVFVEMTHKGLFGGMFLSATRTFHPGFGERLPEWTTITPLFDQRLGIGILWVGGNLVFVVAVASLVLGWVAYERRNARRVDYRLALAREARRKRDAALQQVFEKGV